MEEIRRVLILALSVIMLFSFTACGQQVNTVTTTEATETTTTTTTAAPVMECTEEKELLFQHWENYLAAIENMHAHMHWALSYAKIYAENGDWDSLLKAQAACNAASRYLSDVDYELSYTINDEQTELLSTIGIETDTIHIFYNNFESTQRENVNVIKNLSDTLLYDQCYAPVQQQIVNRCENIQKLLVLYASYECYFTNALYVDLDKEAEWDTFAEKYPYLSLGQKEWLSNKDEIEDQSNEVLDLYEKAQEGTLEILGVQEYVLKLVNEAYTTKNLENLHKALSIPTGTPGVLPIPSFFGADTEIYYYTDTDTDNSTRISTGSSINQTPDGILAICPGVAKEDVEQYEQQLISWNLSPVQQWDEEEQSYTLYLTINDSILFVKWTEQSTSFYLTEGLLFLLPELVLNALNTFGMP